MNAPQTFNLASGFKFKGGGGGGGGGVKIEHRVGIQASSDTIWDLLYDVASWKDWNPLYVEAAGDVRIGSVLTLTMVLPGDEPTTIRPTVLEWVPREQLHWRLKMMGGLITTTRYIEIEEIERGSCIVSNGEIFGGLLGPSVVKRMNRKIWRGFEAMDNALKDAAEARWRAEGGAPTSGS